MNRIPDLDLAVCFVGRGTFFHAVVLTDGAPATRPICGSGRKNSELKVSWDHAGNAYEDAWEAEVVDCPKCLRWMYPQSQLDREGVVTEQLTELAYSLLEAEGSSTVPAV